MQVETEIEKIKRIIYFLQRKTSGGGGGTVDSVNGQTGVVSLAVDDLSDVVAPTPSDNDVLTWDAGTSKWINQAGGGSSAWGGITGTITDQTDLVAYVASAVAGLMDYRGVFDASVNAYPSSGGSGTAGAILKSDFWIVSVAGTLPTGLVVAPGDLVIAKIDTPGNTQANWSLVEYNIGYTPENVANKENTTIDTNTTKYPTVNLLNTGLGTKQPLDATLTALAGLATGANKIPYSTGTDTFGQLDLDTDGTLAANSDTILASQKATKTYVDTINSYTLAVSCLSNLNM